MNIPAQGNGVGSGARTNSEDSVSTSYKNTGSKWMPDDFLHSRDISTEHMGRPVSSHIQRYYVRGKQNTNDSRDGRVSVMVDVN